MGYIIEQWCCRHWYQSINHPC